MEVPVIETERLILRPWQVSDAPAMFAYARDPKVGPNAGWKPHESVEESRATLEEWAKEETDWLWAITERGRDVPIGSLGLHLDDGRPGVTEHRMLGYVLGREYWGRGYMTEAVSAALDHAFAGRHLRLVSVRHYTFNERSRRVIEKCGFTCEGTLRMACVRYDGAVLDDVLYSMTAAEYWLLRAKRLGLRLALPETLPRDAVAAYHERWGSERMVPFSMTPQGSTEEWLAYSIAGRVYCREGRVTATTWLLADSKDTILGALNLRHSLNEALLRTGGHIGYGILPDHRGKKLAPCMLALGLEKAGEKGIDRVLVTCDGTNLPSARTIEACGGRLENTVSVEGGVPVRRYWIDLHK